MSFCVSLYLDTDYDYWAQFCNRSCFFGANWCVALVCLCNICILYLATCLMFICRIVCLCSAISAYVSATQLVCFLPRAVGALQGVVVSNAALFSLAYPLVSYALPVISAITGCAPTGCLRSGNQAVTITGRNFGAASALVWIGSSQCTKVFNNTVTPLVWFPLLLA